MKPKTKTITQNYCHRCEYLWYGNPNKDGLPVKCPRCKNPNWKTEKGKRTWEK